MKSPKNPNRPRGGRPPKPETERLKRRLVVCLTETDYAAPRRPARAAALVRAEYARYGRDTATLAALVDRIDALLTRIDKLP